MTGHHHAGLPKVHLEGGLGANGLMHNAQLSKVSLGVSIGDLWGGEGSAGSVVDGAVEEVARGAALPGLYPPSAETRARYEAGRG